MPDSALAYRGNLGLSERWQFYTVEIAPVGTRGPFGPFQAADADAAWRIGKARAAHSGLTVERVERVEGPTRCVHTGGQNAGVSGYRCPTCEAVEA